MFLCESFLLRQAESREWRVESGESLDKTREDKTTRQEQKVDENSRRERRLKFNS